MTNYADLARELGIKYHFADAHSPWRRGTSENTNGVSRWHRPKGTVIDHTNAQLERSSNRASNAGTVMAMPKRGLQRSPRTCTTGLIVPGRPKC
jgi:IS30 family transposase